jgi:hypothetical protein
LLESALRVEPELVDQPSPRALVGAQGVEGAARPVQSQHELGEHTLPVGMLHSEIEQFVDDGSVPAQPELCVQAFLPDHQPRLLQAPAQLADHLRCCHVGQWGSTPHAERLAE